MRKYETVTKQVETRVLSEITCDICGAIGKSGGWESSLWGVNETDVSVSVRQKEGTAYPESGSGTEYNLDICPKCFKEKLVPWVRSFGGVVDEVEWDF